MKGWLFGSGAVALLLGWTPGGARAETRCHEGLCEVMSLSTESQTKPGSSQTGDGNIVIIDPDSSVPIVHVSCTVSAEVPIDAWAGIEAMFASVRGVTRPPNELNGAQQVMLLFFTSVQDMLKDFSCERAANLWK
jgi:hypothetical protein